MSVKENCGASGVREIHASWIELNEEISQMGMSILGETLTLEMDNQHLIIALLHARALQSFQSCLLLSESRFISDARTLSRCIWEDTFCIGALFEKPQLYLEKFVTKHQKHRHGVANAFLDKSVLRSELSKENLEKFGHVVTETKDAKDKWNWECVAVDAGMSELYDIHYRQLSSDAAHPTLESLMRYVVADAEGNITGFRWLPSDKEIEDTLAIACPAYLCAAMRTGELFNLTSIEKDVESMKNRFVELSKTLG